MPPCLPRPTTTTPSALTASLPTPFVQAGFFYAKLRIRPTAELDRMRMLRRAQVGWVQVRRAAATASTTITSHRFLPHLHLRRQRFVIVAMFLLICAPVVAKYLCRADLSLRSEICN